MVHPLLIWTDPARAVRTISPTGHLFSTLMLHLRANLQQSFVSRAFNVGSARCLNR